MVVLQNTTTFAPVDILTESVLDSGDVKLSFACRLHDTQKNNNKRVYDNRSLNVINSQLSPKAQNRKLAGEMGHPLPTGDQASTLRRMATIDPNNVGVLFTKFNYKNGVIDAEAETMTNDKGRNLYAMIKDNVGIGFSYRGFGRTDQSGVVLPQTVKSITYDVVFNESNNGSVVTEIFTESSNFSDLYNEISGYHNSLESILTESSGIVEIDNCPLGQCNIDNVKMLKDYILESTIITQNFANLKITFR